MTENKEFKPATHDDWMVFLRFNEEFKRKNGGKSIIDIDTIRFMADYKLNPEKYDTRLPDELINRTDGKVAVVFPFNQKKTEIMDEEEYERLLNTKSVLKTKDEEGLTVEEIKPELLTIEEKKE